MVKPDENIKKEHMRNADLSKLTKFKSEGTNEHFYLF